MKADYGELTSARIGHIAGEMRAQTDALARLCGNLGDYGTTTGGSGIWSSASWLG